MSHAPGLALELAAALALALAPGLADALATVSALALALVLAPALAPAPVPPQPLAAAEALLLHLPRLSRDCAEIDRPSAAPPPAAPRRKPLTS